ncbi:hypothetical protein ACRAWD_24160 [Caulobacter segnis]
MGDRVNDALGVRRGRRGLRDARALVHLRRRQRPGGGPEHAARPERRLEPGRP